MQILHDRSSAIAAAHGPTILAGTVLILVNNSELAVQLPLQFGLNRLVDRGLGDVPENSAHDGKRHETDGRHGESALYAGGSQPAAADCDGHGQGSENSGVDSTHRGSQAGRQTFRSRANLTSVRVAV
jgi:hypothetical protein